MQAAPCVVHPLTLCKVLAELPGSHNAASDHCSEQTLACMPLAAQLPCGGPSPLGSLPFLVTLGRKVFRRSQ